MSSFVFSFQVWAIDNRRLAYVRVGITDNMPIGKEWIHVPGNNISFSQCKQIIKLLLITFLKKYEGKFEGKLFSLLHCYRKIMF